jgi:hypothetical protein
MPKVGEIISRDSGTRRGKRKHVWAACEICGKERWVQLGKSIKRCTKCRRIGILHTEVTKDKLRNGHRGQNSKMWKGGRYIGGGGYIYIWLSPDSPYFLMTLSNGHGYGAYVAEHRLVMAKHLGRCLESSEIVHHIDGNRENNNLGNLKLAIKQTHSLRYANAYSDGYKRGYEDARKELLKEV